MVEERQHQAYESDSTGEVTASRGPGTTSTGPRDLVVLTRERIESTLRDAAASGQMTRGTATEIAEILLERGRITRDDLPADVERARRDVERAGASPIPDYDELTAAQLSGRIMQLDHDQLRSLREHERRNANRKSVLAAVEQQLS